MYTTSNNLIASKRTSYRSGDATNIRGSALEILRQLGVVRV